MRNRHRTVLGGLGILGESMILHDCFIFFFIILARICRAHFSLSLVEECCRLYGPVPRHIETPISILAREDLFETSKSTMAPSRASLDEMFVGFNSTYVLYRVPD